MRKPTSITLKAVLWASLMAVAAVFGAAATTLAQRVPSQMELRLLEDTILLEGLDPVLLIQGKEAQGKFDLVVKRGHFKYLFASVETKAAFEANPEKYEVQMDGLCARMGRSTRGNADLYAVHDGKIYLFGSQNCKAEFLKTPQSYIEKPPADLTGSREATQQGRALLEKAVEALGGAAKIDSIHSYRHQGKQTATIQQQTVELLLALMWERPGRVREERSFGPGNLFVTVLTADDAFTVSSRGRRAAFRELSPGQRQYDEKALFQRRLLTVLQARQQPGFRVVALGAAESGGARVERVAVQYQRIQVTLCIQPDSGLVHSMSYMDRGRGGVVTEVTELYSDFRLVGDVRLPFQVTSTANGETDPFRTYQLDSISINPPLAASLFARPEEARKQ